MIAAVLKRLLGPKRIIDPALGELEYVGAGRWIGRTSETLSFVIESPHGGLDPELRAVLIRALSDPTLERVARDYLRDEPRGRGLRLSSRFSTEVSRARPLWIKTALSRGLLDSSASICSGDALTILAFGLDDDRNVVEVIFKGNDPVAIDYH